MDKGLGVVIGMTLAYIASFAGMAFAWHYYRRNKKESHKKDERV